MAQKKCGRHSWNFQMKCVFLQFHKYPSYSVPNTDLFMLIANVSTGTNRWNRNRKLPLFRTCFDGFYCFFFKHPGEEQICAQSDLWLLTGALKPGSWSVPGPLSNITNKRSLAIEKVIKRFFVYSTHVFIFCFLFVHLLWFCFMRERVGVKTLKDKWLFYMLGALMAILKRVEIVFHLH